MPKPTTDYEDEAPTRVETPLPTRYEPTTRQLLLLLDDEPAEHPGSERT